MSDSVWPHRRQPTRLLRPWDSLGKNTGVGCYFLLQCMKVKSESEVSQSCPTLSDPMDCSLPGSSIHGIFQASTAVGCFFQFVLADTEAIRPLEVYALSIGQAFIPSHLLLKTSHMACLNLRRWKNTVHLWMGIAAKLVAICYLHSCYRWFIIYRIDSIHCKITDMFFRQ